MGLRRDRPAATGGDAGTDRSGRRSRGGTGRPVRQEVGLWLATLPKEVIRYLFTYRRNPDLTADGKAWSMLLRDVRPVGNALPGYTASYALSQATGDE